MLRRLYYRLYFKFFYYSPEMENPNPDEFVKD